MPANEKNAPAATATASDPFAALEMVTGELPKSVRPREGSDSALPPKLVEAVKNTYGKDAYAKLPGVDAGILKTLVSQIRRAGTANGWGTRIRIHDASGTPVKVPGTNGKQPEAKGKVTVSFKAVDARNSGTETVTPEPVAAPETAPEKPSK